MKETMTVHEALCELKTLSKRIIKLIEECNPVSRKEHGANQINGKPVADTIERIKSEHESLMSLINRQTAIKAAINGYNAEKHITVDGKDYSVAQAIYMMNYGTLLKHQVLSKYADAMGKNNQFIERANGDNLNERAERAMTSIYGSKEKADPAAYLKGLMDYKEAHTIEAIDPIGIADVVKKLSDEVDSFEAHVDSALQIANATTQIEIEY